VSIAVITGMFALMYKILPRVRIGWHDVWVGAIATAALFTIGKVLVGLYLGKSSIASSFGTAGALAVLLVWVYYSAPVVYKVMAWTALPKIRTTPANTVRFCWSSTQRQPAAVPRRRCDRRRPRHLAPGR